MAELKNQEIRLWGLAGPSLAANLIFFLWWLPFGTLQAVAPSRIDLSRPLSGLICRGKQAISTPSPFEFWRHNIYDAHVEIQTLSNTTLQYNQNTLMKAAKIIARKKNHFGTTGGICADGKGWIATTPAPVASLRAKDGQITLLPPSMEKHCRIIKIDFASQAGGKPRRLKVLRQQYADTKSVTINADFLSDGLISVTCYPRQKRSQGPVPWFFIPVGHGPDPRVPFADVLTESAEHQNPLLQWINQVRAQEQLSQVQLADPQTSSQLIELSEKKTTQHHRRRLLAIRKKVRALGGSFIGENRAKAATRMELAWLLWNSPRHRKLLLAAKSTYVTLLETQVQDQILAIMLFTNF